MSATKLQTEQMKSNFNFKPNHTEHHQIKQNTRSQSFLRYKQNKKEISQFCNIQSVPKSMHKIKQLDKKIIKSSFKTQTTLTTLK